jgi:hypothetical protein
VVGVAADARRSVRITAAGARRGAAGANDSDASITADGLELYFATRSCQ